IIGNPSLNHRYRKGFYSLFKTLQQNRMRQREGIELAKKEGKFKGRLKKYHKNHAGMNYAVKLYKEGNMTVNQICEITNVSRASLYRKLSEVNN
ncbi:helix-turn-helix domain-containing protein, partial [Enterococcus faecium]